MLLAFCPNYDNRGDCNFHTAREKQLSYEMDQIQNLIDAQGRRLPPIRVTALKNRINDLGNESNSVRGVTSLAKDTLPLPLFYAGAADNFAM